MHGLEMVCCENIAQPGGPYYMPDVGHLGFSRSTLCTADSTPLNRRNKERAAQFVSLDDGCYVCAYVYACV